GRERAAIGGTLGAGIRIEPQALERLANFRGHLEQAWSQVQIYLQSDNASPLIVERAQAVQSKFFGPYEELRQSVYRAGLVGTAYPINDATWIAEATAAIDQLSELGRTASSVAADFAARSAAGGQRS